MKTTNNTILITGGGTGIGRGLAEAFHAAGNQVIICGRTAETLDETTAANPGMASLTFDTSDARSIHELAKRVIADFPNLNVLINNAGMMRQEDFLADDHDSAGAEATVVTNLLGPIRLTNGLLPHLRKQPAATVMTVTSGLAFLPLTMTPTYCATKAALHSYSESLRYQLRESSVEVLELAPPYVQTSLTGARQKADPRAMPLDEFIDEVMAIIASEPASGEICVERVLALRNAANSGRDHYQKQFIGFNETMAAGHES